jgi:hypothetical protein
MEIRVGHYYRDPDDGEVIRIDRIEGNTVYYTHFESPEYPTRVDMTGWYTKNVLQKFYTHLPAYNSPLWKVLYG